MLNCRGQKRSGAFISVWPSVICTAKSTSHYKRLSVGLCRTSADHVVASWRPCGWCCRALAVLGLCWEKGGRVKWGEVSGPRLRPRPLPAHFPPARSRAISLPRAFRPSAPDTLCRCLVEEGAEKRWRVASASPPARSTAIRPAPHSYHACSAAHAPAAVLREAALPQEGPAP